MTELLLMLRLLLLLFVFIAKAVLLLLLSSRASNTYGEFINSYFDFSCSGDFICEVSRTGASSSCSSS